MLEKKTALDCYSNSCTKTFDKYVVRDTRALTLNPWFQIIGIYLFGTILTQFSGSA